MRISIDRDRCEGHGLCEEKAPEVFSLDDDGNLTYHFEGTAVPVEHQDAARSATTVCPVLALRLAS